MSREDDIVRGLPGNKGKKSRWTPLIIISIAAAVAVATLVVVQHEIVATLVVVQHEIKPAGDAATTATAPRHDAATR